MKDEECASTVRYVYTKLLYHFLRVSLLLSAQNVHFPLYESLARSSIHSSHTSLASSSFSTTLQPATINTMAAKNTSPHSKKSNASPASPRTDNSSSFENTKAEPAPPNVALDIARQVGSCALLGWSVAVICSAIFGEKTGAAGDYDIPPIITFIVFCGMLLFLSTMEGGQGCLVGLQPTEKAKYVNSHPTTHKCTTMAHNGDNMERFVVGRQFLVVLSIFIINTCGGSLADVSVLGMGSTLNAIFLDNGLAMILATIILGQITAQVSNVFFLSIDANAFLFTHSILLLLPFLSLFSFLLRLTLRSVCWTTQTVTSSCSSPTSLLVSSSVAFFIPFISSSISLLQLPECRLRVRRLLAMALETSSSSRELLEVLHFSCSHLPQLSPLFSLAGLRCGTASLQFQLSSSLPFSSASLESWRACRLHFLPLSSSMERYLSSLYHHALCPS
jgi:hypothetical protein